MQAYGANSRLGHPGEITALAAGPLYHAAPLAYMNFFVRLGSNLIIEPKVNAERMLQIIAREKVTHLLAVPTKFVRLLGLPREVRNAYDLSSLEFVMHGAAPCATHIKHRMIDWWGPIICEHYGGTEAGVLTFCDSSDWQDHPGTVGRAMDGVSLRILDAEKADCRAGEVGESFGRRLMFPDCEYYGDSSKRKAVEHEGLISLGDRGYLDEDGYLYLTGRNSDMIIAGGVNIYPAEIEAELLTAPGVADCAVFGIPDSDLGESVLAIVQPVAGAELDPDAIGRFLRARLSSYKVPKRFEFRDSLPREDSGKIFKRKLREPYWADTGRDI